MELARIEFGHLRDLPLYGRKQWESYFQKAFQLYAHVWKFQQDNRADLTDEGLKRWEIGDVASRIGQVQAAFLCHYIPNKTGPLASTPAHRQEQGQKSLPATLEGTQASTNCKYD